MSYGEVSGNQSVHWTIVHEDASGKPKQQRAANGQRAGAPARNEVSIDMSVEGHDDISFDDIGGSAHPKAFRVRARFATREAAEAAAQAALKGIAQTGGAWLMTLDVPAIRRETPKENPPAEVRVQW